MARIGVTPEILNAYADGELSPAEEARVARLVSGSPQLARELAEIEEMREGVAALAHGHVPDGLWAMPKAPEAAPRARHGLPFALVAGLALGGLGLSAWFFALRPLDEPVPLASTVPYLDRHDAWLSGAHERSAEVPSQATWQIASLLAATGLHLVFEENVVLRGGAKVRHAGFEGRNGCRVSLFRASGTGGDGASELTLGLSRADGILTARWVLGDAGYSLVARGMDEHRFTTIALAIHAATESAETRPLHVAALAAARERCLG